MKKSYFIIIAFAMAGAAACSKDDAEKPDPQEPTITVQTVTNLAADTAGTGSYTLFSLEENKIIPNADSASTKWDIGFRSLNVIMNGGTSGPGATSGQIIDALYDTVMVAPADGYQVDAEGMMPIKSWYNYDFTSHLVTPLPAKVILVKTSKGNYAKIKIYSYYKDAPENPEYTMPSRLISFHYVLNASGTREFE